ncbi:hypothetical protein [Phycicoccus flavus]|uniref:hypothetical protein n=1 Tax=Phycicoccus flavus TaxID=2502783 RepID=UPI00197BD782|nr:hypothetical protein [Phycicoccus flavus]
MPFFGDYSSASVATVGINPSNREFVNVSGAELSDSQRRLPTLSSLGRSSWAEVSGEQLVEIVNACRLYFRANPYDRWFQVLERLLSGTATFYGTNPSACHLDLIPYATEGKWGNLPAKDQRALLNGSRDALGLILRDSGIRMLILNGASVVREFDRLLDQPLTAKEMEGWALPRSSGSDIPGYAYTGTITELGGVELAESVRVFGYNHNLQSSFGVTAEVVRNISVWLCAKIDRAQL